MIGMGLNFGVGRPRKLFRTRDGESIANPQMSAREIIFIISISVFVIASFLTNMFHMMMVDQINDKRPVENHISHIRHRVPLIMHIIREYRSLYPQGKLHIYTLGSFALVLINVILLVVNSLPLS
jgi:hypothetical protein